MLSQPIWPTCPNEVRISGRCPVGCLSGYIDLARICHSRFWRRDWLEDQRCLRLHLFQKSAGGIGQQLCGGTVR